MDKDELIAMLRVLKDSCFPADGGMATVIYDVTQDSFLWVLDETIEVLEEGE